jgi:hypothetical protein
MKGRNGTWLGSAPSWQGRTPPTDDSTDKSSQTTESPVLVYTALKAADVGMQVVEDHAGSAVGQWVLHVRCQCGRRWFELEAVTASTCPRCGLLVYVDIDRPHART